MNYVSSRDSLFSEIQLSKMMFKLRVEVTKVFNMLFMVNDGVFVHFDAFSTHARFFIFYCIRKIEMFLIV